MAMPPCPRCGTNKLVNTHGHDGYFCGKCNGLFDNDPDEGGSFSDRDPSARLEREERLKQQRQQQRKRRF